MEVIFSKKIIEFLIIFNFLPLIISLYLSKEKNINKII
jgi:hypothetical protein